MTRPVTIHDEISALIRIFRLISSIGRLNAIPTPKSGERNAVSQFPTILAIHCFRVFMNSMR